MLGLHLLSPQRLSRSWFFRQNYLCCPGDPEGLDVKDIQELAAFARKQRDVAQSVRLSDVDQQQWATIQSSAGSDSASLSFYYCAAY